jgi:hypothetical protein
MTYQGYEGPTQGTYELTPVSDQWAKMTWFQDGFTREVCVKREPEPLLPSGRKFTAWIHYENPSSFMPLYLGEETIGALYQRLRQIWIPAVDVIKGQQPA